jgi:hypothetical protein
MRPLVPQIDLSLTKSALYARGTFVAFEPRQRLAWLNLTRSARPSSHLEPRRRGVSNRAEEVASLNHFHPSAGPWASAPRIADSVRGPYRGRRVRVE